MIPQHIVKLQEGLMKPIPLVFDRNEEKSDRFKVGETYTLQGASCDGFNMPIRTYVCKGILKTIHNCEINALIMQQIDGDEESIISLTRSDCELFGVKFEPRLQLLPMSFDWVSTNRITPRSFDENNLGTYNHCQVDNKIRQMHITINSIHSYHKGYLITPTGVSMPIDAFLHNLQIYFKDIQLQSNRITHRALSLKSDGTALIDEDKNLINFMLFFNEGVDIEYFEDKNLDDVFGVRWSEPSNPRWEREVNMRYYIPR